MKFNVFAWLLLWQLLGCEFPSASIRSTKSNRSDDPRFFSLAEIEALLASQAKDRSEREPKGKSFATGETLEVEQLSPTQGAVGLSWVRRKVQKIRTKVETALRNPQGIKKPASAAKPQSKAYLEALADELSSRSKAIEVVPLAHDGGCNGAPEGKPFRLLIIDKHHQASAIVHLQRESAAGLGKHQKIKLQPKVRFPVSTPESLHDAEDFLNEAFVPAPGDAPELHHQKIENAYKELFRRGWILPSSRIIDGLLGRVLRDEESLDDVLKKIELNDVREFLGPGPGAWEDNHGRPWRWSDLAFHVADHVALLRDKPLRSLMSYVGDYLETVGNAEVFYPLAQSHDAGVLEQRIHPIEGGSLPRFGQFYLAAFLELLWRSNVTSHFIGSQVQRLAEANSALAPLPDAAVVQNGWWHHARILQAWCGRFHQISPQFENSSPSDFISNVTRFLDESAWKECVVEATAIFLQDVREYHRFRSILGAPDAASADEND